MKHFLKTVAVVFLATFFAVWPVNAQFTPDLSGTYFAQHRKYIRVHDEFIGSAGAGLIGSGGFFAENLTSGAIGNTHASGTAGTNPGQISLTIATNSGSFASMRAHSTTAIAIPFGGSQIYVEAMVRLEELGDANNDFQFWFGWNQGSTFGTGSTSTNCAIRYRNSVSSGAWNGNTTVAAGNTAVVGSAVVADTWYRLGILVNAAGTSVNFYVDGILIGTSATNIPAAGSAGALQVGFIAMSGMGAGSGSSKLAYVDYITQFYTLTTAR